MIVILNLGVFMKNFVRSVLCLATAFACVSSFASADTLNIYSYRSQLLLQPLLDAYTAETGTNFNIVHAPKGLVQRLQAEGANTKADLVMTVDISRIAELAETGLLTELQSDIIEANVPHYHRDERDLWTALSSRARIVAISKDRVAKGAIQNIEDLANPDWKGRLCTRKGSHVYNRALLASIIAHNGEAEAKAWAEALVGNLARKPQGNDRAQAKAIWAGECDIAIMNTYYYGKMKFNDKEPEQKQWADSIELIFLNQAGRGQHVNVTGAGILKTSKNQQAARAFLEWLTEEKAQKIYASVNYEYPINPTVAADPEVFSWGQFKVDALPITEVARLSPKAQMIIDQTGW